VQATEKRMNPSQLATAHNNGHKGSKVMKNLKSFGTIAFICLMVWSLCACAAPHKQSPTPTSTSTPVPALALVPTQTISNREYLQVFESVWSTIDQTFFDPDFGGLDWDTIHEKYEPLIAAAGDDAKLYQLLNQMIWELKVSHAAVGPAEEWLSAEPVVWEAGETGIDIRLLFNQAVITHVKAGSPAQQAGLRPGFIIQSIDATPVEQIIASVEGYLGPPYNPAGRIDGLTRHLLSLIYGDPGTCVTLAYLDEKDELHEACVERIHRPWVGDPGGGMPTFYLEFERSRLEGGVGYIRFNTFYSDLIPDLVQAIAALQDAPGIIIDLRGNPGGEFDTDGQMAAQFLDGQVTFGKIRTRSETVPWILTGKNGYAGPLVILIDALSFSGSEFFSSGMQAVGRAAIIGERSPGGASEGNIKSLPNGAILVYPVAELLTPDGKVVEGYGIIPDITVTLERSQLLAGIDAQLQAAIDYIVENGR
jgi:carboxyl-terminal processing protease